MLDRKTIKKDVKGILGGESRGPVFLVTLISFIIVLVYFGAVWVIAQFYPISMSELEAIRTWSQSQVLIAPQTDAMQTYNAAMAIVTNALTAFGRTLSSIGSINCWAWLLELILLLPLGIGIQKFMLRVIRLKNPGASTVLRGYTAPYFFRSIIMPFWKQICYLGWRIILFIILCGLMAGTALATGLKAQDFTVLSAGVTGEAVSGIFSAEYLNQYGWIYPVVWGAWSLLSCWLMLFKRISYSLAEMALAERPQIGVRKALRASRRIARRNHFALFMVSLSFIGWYILAYLAVVLVVAVGVGLNMLNMGQLGLIITLAVALIALLLIMYLLAPYRVGVHAQCYVRLKRAALEDGVVVREDFRSKRELREMEEQQ